MPEEEVQKIDGKTCLRVLDHIIEKLLKDYIKFFIEESKRVGEDIARITPAEERNIILMIYNQKMQSYLAESLYEVLMHYVSLKAWALTLQQYGLLECEVGDDYINATYNMKELVKRLSTS